MTRWLVRRTVDGIVVTGVAAVLLVLLVHALPGDPLAALIGEQAVDPARLAALRARWHTDRGPLEAAAAWFGAAARGDLGTSHMLERPVAALLAERLPATLLLGALTLLIDFTVGLALGVWSALRPTGWRARGVGVLTVTGYALPSFVIGMLLVWCFAIVLPWFPPAGTRDPLLAPDASTIVVLLDRLRHLALPLATMVLATIALPLRHQRAAVLAVREAPWVLAARARGVGPWRLAWRHCWRPALTPVITLLGLWLPMLVAGSVFVEHLFAWPGLGALLAQASARRDVDTVIGAGLLVVVAVQVGALLADLLARLADPEQRT